MSLAIIHLTDIHIRDQRDSILRKQSAITDSCNERLESVDDAIIVVSGDLASAGQLSQYNVCCQFLESIAKKIHTRSDMPVKVVTVPGNHDCDFSNAQYQKVRSLLLEQISRNNIENFDVIKVQEAVIPQKNYFESTKHFYSLTAENPIRTDYYFDQSIGRVCFTLYNTAWISEMHETPGQLCMPINLLDQMPSEQADLFITIAHHPLHWMHPDNMIAFRSIIRKSSDITIWGHEHYLDSIMEKGEGWNFVSLEGRELQDSRNKDRSAFSIYIINDEITSIEKMLFEWKGNKYYLQSNNKNEFIRNTASVLHVMYPNRNMLAELDDYGTLVHHPHKDKILLHDLYVWPELVPIDLKNGRDGQTVSADIEGKSFLCEQITIIAGDEATGKTALSKQLYKLFLADNKNCLLINGKDLTARSEDRLRNQIESTFSDQYNRNLLDRFNTLSIEQRVLIIDDFDLLVQSNRKYWETIDQLKALFDSIILLTSIDVNISYIIAQLNATCHRKVAAYHIRHMGNSKRHELIEKWYTISDALDHDTIKKESLITNATNLVNTMIERFSRIAPATPLLVVSILQSIDSQGKSSINQYNYMYEQLVQQSLVVISNNNQALQNIYVSVLSIMAYRMLCEKKRTISASELIEVITQYKKDMLLQFNPVSIIKQLSESGVLVDSDNSKYRFRYPYMYYYFAGLYISRNLRSKEIKDQIDYMSEHLYVEDYGNIMVFICHFTNDEYVIDSVLTCAMCSLDQFEKFDFGKPTAILENVYEAIDQQNATLLVGTEEDVEAQHKQELKRMDERGIHDGTISSTTDEKINEEPKGIAEVISAIRIIDVVGQILKNYPGEITGNKKVEMISSITDLAMRVVGLMYAAIGSSQEDFIDILTETIQDAHPDATATEVANAVKIMFASLVCGTACGMIQSVSSAIGSKVLLPAIKAAKETYPNDTALALVYANSSLLSFERNIADELVQLSIELKDKKLWYAYETMRFLVSKYLRVYHYGDNQRNKLCDAYKLSKAQSAMILPE